MDIIDNKALKQGLSIGGGAAIGNILGGALGSSALGTLAGGAAGYFYSDKSNKNSNKKINDLTQKVKDKDVELKSNKKELEGLSNTKKWIEGRDKISADTYNSEKKEYDEGFNKFIDPDKFDKYNDSQKQVVKDLYNNTWKTGNHTFNSDDITKSYAGDDLNNLINSKQNDYIKNNKLTNNSQYNPYLDNDICSCLDFVDFSEDEKEDKNKDKDKNKSSIGKDLLFTLGGTAFGAYLGNRIGGVKGAAVGGLTGAAASSIYNNINTISKNNKITSDPDYNEYKQKKNSLNKYNAKQLDEAVNYRKANRDQYFKDHPEISNSPNRNDYFNTHAKAYNQRYDYDDKDLDEWEAATDEKSKEKFMKSRRQIQLSQRNNISKNNMKNFNIRDTADNMYEVMYNNVSPAMQQRLDKYMGPNDVYKIYKKLDDGSYEYHNPAAVRLTNTGTGAVIGGLVGSIGGGVLGHYLSDKIGFNKVIGALSGSAIGGTLGSTVGGSIGYAVPGYKGLKR